MTRISCSGYRTGRLFSLVPSPSTPLFHVKAAPVGAARWCSLRDCYASASFSLPPTALTVAALTLLYRELLRTTAPRHDGNRAILGTSRIQDSARTFGLGRRTRRR